MTLGEMTRRPNAGLVVEMCKHGILNPVQVLENALYNYMSLDDAEDFCESEYQSIMEDENDNH